MLEFDETKEYPAQKPMRRPSGPPKWKEGPQIPPEILKKLKGRKRESYNPDQPRNANGEWGSGGGDSSSSGDATKQQSWKQFWDDFEFKSDKATSADTGHEKTPEPETGGHGDETKSFDDMSTDEKEAYLQENGGKEWEESLSDAEKSAIEKYSDSGYFTMQDVLRGDAKGDKYWKGQIKDATSGLMKGKAPEDMTVVRGTGAEEFKLMSGLEGEGYIAKGFTSTTVDPSFVSNRTMKMHITVPKGSPGAYITSVSGHQNEREWLLPPNSKFRVDKISGGNAHLTYLGVHKSKK